MSRLAELEARRRALLERCEQQRVELARRVAQLLPGALLRASGAQSDGAGPAGRHPLAWVAALAGLMLLRRSRDVLTLLAWIRTALSLAAGAARLSRVITRRRAPRASGTK